MRHHLLSWASLGLAGCGSEAPAPPPPPEVTVAEVKAEQITEWDEYQGEFEAVDAVEVRPRVSGYLKRVTVAYYLEGLIPHPMPNDSSLASLLQTVRNTPAVPVSVICLLLITAIALALGVRAVENREYVLEQ